MASSSQGAGTVQAAAKVDSFFAGAQDWDGAVSPKSANAVTMPEVGLLSKLPFFSIKNGVPNEATSLLVKATIARTYHWRPVEGLPAQRAKEYVGVFIKTAYLGIKANQPTGLPDNKVIKAAVLIGVARAVVTAYYEITAEDLIPEEVAPAIFKASHVGNGAYEFTPVANLDAKIVESMNDAINIDQAINDAIPSIHMSSIGLPALQGWSLMMTGHHYLSDTGSQSRKAFAVVERQFWRANNVASWWNDDIDLCTDALWHKACHPISLKLKHRYATSDAVKEMILVAGAGSAAARLPAKEAELRAANSHLVLMQTVRSMFEAYGRKLEHVSVLSYAVDLAKSYPSDPTEPQMPFDRVGGTPAWVVDRSTALRFVAEVMDANADITAHAFGFYMAMTEQSALMGNAVTTDTIKMSFSLTKLKNQRMAAYTAGYQAYADYTAFKAKH